MVMSRSKSLEAWAGKGQRRPLFRQKKRTVVPVEQDPAREHLRENAAGAPHVDGGGVGGQAEADLGSTVHERDNL